MSISTINRPRTSRHRGGAAYEERRTNAWAGMLGFLTGRGYSSFAIAEALGEGTSHETVRRMWTLWGLRSRGLKSREVCIMVPMKERDRATIQARAAQEGLSMEEWLRQLAVAAAQQKSTFRSIVKEGQFE